LFAPLNETESTTTAFLCTLSLLILPSFLPSFLHDETQKVKLWDIEKGVEMNSFGGHSELIQDIVWDYTGRGYATSCKDKVSVGGC